MTDDELIACFGVAARFKIHVRCAGCLQDNICVLDVPDVAEAPLTVDELIESPLLGRQRFRCERCESSIGTIVGVTTFRRRDAA
jgi:hypothetical protein